LGLLQFKYWRDPTVAPIFDTGRPGERVTSKYQGNLYGLHKERIFDMISP